MRPAPLALMLLAALPGLADGPRGPYLGQRPPAAEPQVFAPGTVSTFMNDRDIALSPDGKEIYFCVLHRPYFTILFVRQAEDGCWSKPQVAPFSGCFDDCEPAFSPDGRRLWFCSTRPLDGKGSAKDYDLWYVERTPTGWSEPRNPGAPLNSPRNEFFPSITRDGTVYFTSHDMKLMRCRPDGKGGHASPEPLPAPVNGRTEYNACVTPDEDCLVFTSHTPAFRAGALVVSFRTAKDAWTVPIPLGAGINTGEGEMSPAFSPDGNFLFFSSRRTRDTRGIHRPLNQEDVRAVALSPQNGLSDLYWVDARHLRDLRRKVEETQVVTSGGTGQ